jgi:hypothetical protein
LFQNTLGKRERHVWLQLAILAMFSSLAIKGNEEVDLTIGVELERNITFLLYLS